MFLPMSWTSPLTVAITSLPWALRGPPAASSASFSASMNGSRYATARFIARALFTTCGRNILPAPNSSPTTFMPSINGPSMTSSGRPYFTRASSASCFDEVDHAVHQRVRQARLDRAVAPFQIGLALGGRAFHLLRERHHPLGRVRPAVEDDVFDVLEQVLRNVLVDHQLAGIDDAHVHAGLDGVEQERGVNRLADDVVAAERERQVADPAADLHARALLP